MAAGRFRVKSGIDQATAFALARDLSSLGAMCLVADQGGRVIGRVPAPETHSAPDASHAQATHQPAAAQSSAPEKYHSGLAAATASSASQQDLGALGAGVDRLSLATLDGHPDDASGMAEDVPQEVTRPAVSIAAFAPPAAEQQDLQLAIDIPRRTPSDAVDSHTAVITDAPPPAALMEEDSYQAVPPSARRSRRLPQSASGFDPQARDGHATGEELPRADSHLARGGVSAHASPLHRLRTLLADSTRIRFAAGVFAALLLGFLPAMIYAQVSLGELDDIDSELHAHQAAVTDIDAWNRLDEYRSIALERKQSRSDNIALGGMLIWAVCGAGLGFFWFRRIDWSFYRTPPARAQSFAGPPDGP